MKFLAHLLMIPLTYLGAGALQAATITLPVPIGIEINKPLTVDPAVLPPAWQDLVTSYKVIEFTISTTDPDLVVEKTAPMTSSVTAKKRGARKAKAAIRIEGSEVLHNVNLTIVGYELDRSELITPKADSYQNLEIINESTPLKMTATIRMRPYVPNVFWNMHFFAHSSKFINDQRSFHVVTGWPKTSIGEAGWKIQTDPATGERVGSLSFRIITPGNERSFCLQTEQTPYLPPTPADVFPPTSSN